MDKKTLMKISELSSLSDTPISTIKYYSSENILPPPLKAGKTLFYYTDEHLDRLKLIKKMKKDRLSIKMMKDVLHQQPDDPESYDINKVHHVKRDSILQAAIAVFREKGFNDTTITDIVNEAGVGRNTFYVHFQNKEALFFECSDLIFNDLDSSLDDLKDLDDILERARKRVTHVFENPQLMDMINLIKGSSINNPTFRKKMIEIIRAYIKPIQKELDAGYEKGIIKKVDNKLFGYLLMGLVEYGFYHYHYEDHAPFDDFFNTMTDFVLNGIKAG